MERARIILACLEGKEIQQVAQELKVSIPTVGKWRRRFAQRGLEGLRDRPRPGKPPKLSTRKAQMVVTAAQKMLGAIARRTCGIESSGCANASW